jgi:hypothetical protein
MDDLPADRFRSQLRRIDRLIVARDGPSAKPGDRGSLDRQIRRARTYLSVLLDDRPPRPGDLRRSRL